MSAMKEELLTMVEAVDWVFGEGYAKKNPELVGRMIQAEYVGLAISTLGDAVNILLGVEETIHSQ